MNCDDIRFILLFTVFWE